ncbi:MAG TPA: hypothetical protein VGR21_09370 [Cryptosporangiaceae bacterium]|nr:hypothetical protein [Cryptosporangiaceae bacterium]
MHGINEELSMEYAMARRLLPGATVDQIAERITGRLTAEQHLVLAQDTLLWHEEPADRRELALIAVRNFVLAIESDPEGDGPEEPDKPLR